MVVDGIQRIASGEGAVNQKRRGKSRRHDAERELAANRLGPRVASSQMVAGAIREIEVILVRHAPLSTPRSRSSDRCARRSQAQVHEMAKKAKSSSRQPPISTIRLRLIDAQRRRCRKPDRRRGEACAKRVGRH